MKKNIKKMDEAELAMMASISTIDGFKAKTIMIRKGDIENVLSRPKCNNDDEDWSIPMKDMTRQERRKATFRKDKGRQTRAHQLGYNISSDMTNGKVQALLSANHSDRMYFRGSKVQKKLGKAMNTIEARNLMAQMEQEAEEDRESARKEAERQFMLDELASTTDDLNRLKDMEAEAKKVVSDLIRTIHEANNKLQDYQVKMNGLRAGKLYLEDEIAKLEKALEQ